MEIRYARLTSLGLAERLVRHLTGDAPVEHLRFRCQSPLYWRTSPLAMRSIVPLWECGMVLSYFCEQSEQFEKCSLESPAVPWVRYTSLQAMLADLMVDLYEDDLGDDDLRAVSNALGFLDIDRFLFRIAGGHADNTLRATEYTQWRERFCSSFETPAF